VRWCSELQGLREAVLSRGRSGKAMSDSWAGIFRRAISACSKNVGLRHDTRDVGVNATQFSDFLHQGFACCSEVTPLGQRKYHAVTKYPEIRQGLPSILKPLVNQVGRRYQEKYMLATMSTVFQNNHDYQYSGITAPTTKSHSFPTSQSRIAEIHTP
jgi:hypothetical protein